MGSVLEEPLLLTREELLDILAAELGAFDDRMADARKHLLEPRADLTLADLFGALLDLLGRSVHLALVGGAGCVPGQGHDREECRSDPEPATFPRHDAPPSVRSPLACMHRPCQVCAIHICPIYLARKPCSMGDIILRGKNYRLLPLPP